MRAKHHIIISGTGRAGTTFLIQLLTVMGFDTGFTDTTSAVDPNCHAGMERDIRLPDAPYIIKNPWLCDDLNDIVQGGAMVIDHAFVPMRDLFSAAQSRRDVTKRADPQLYPAGVPGGLWHTASPEQQEAILAQQLYKLLYALAKHAIPMTLLYFPRFIHDPQYLYATLSPVLKMRWYRSFLKAFKQVACPELIHEFTRDSK